MFKRNDSTHIRTTRGLIVDLIYLAWQSEALSPDNPTTISHNVLIVAMEQLKSLPSDSDLKTCLHYLEGKGYVRVGWANDGTGNFEWVNLTPQGIDLAEKTTTDAGVLFPHRGR